MVADPDGAELPDLATARIRAETAICHAVRRPASAGRDLGRRRFEIMDESGRLLATVAFWDVFGLH